MVRFRFLIFVITGLPSILWSQLNSVTVTPGNSTVGSVSGHTIAFTTTNAFPADGRIVFVYPSGFDLSSVSGSSATIDGSFTINTVGTTVTVIRNNDGNPTAPGDLDFTLLSVTNTTSTGNYTVDVETENSGGNPIDSGTSSSFAITPGVLASFTLNNVPGTTQAGQQLSSDIEVTAFDGYGNQKTDYSGTVTWNSSDPYPATLPLDDGIGWSNGQKTFIGSLFILYRTPSQTITVQDGPISRTSGSINVTQAAVNSFNWSISGGYTQTAGTPFSLSITGAQDQYGNNWTGLVSVTASSGGGNSPGGNPPIYSNITVTDGSGSEDQTLTNAVPTVLQGTAGGLTKNTDVITVNPATLNNFNLSASSPQTAGSGFTLSISGAQDPYGNFWSGEVAIDASAGGGNAPDGTQPSFNNIVVSGETGSGSALQTLYNAVNTTLHGQFGGVDGYTSSIQVNAGSLKEFILQGCPSSVTAGDNFSSGITVSAYDAFGNLKTNYTGQVYFTSTDPQAQLTFNLTSQYTFVLGDSGSRTFLGSDFQLRTAGTQTMTVRDDTPDPDVTETSNSITVNAAAINSFTLSCGTTQTAGEAFLMSVSNAQDQYGNNWSGPVTVSAISGGGNSPNGASPTFNNINVLNDSGQSNQTLVNAESGVTLQAQAGGVTRTVAGITVNPNVLAGLKIRDSVGGGGSEVITHTMNVGETLTLYSAGYDVYDNYREDENTNWISFGLYPLVNVKNDSSITFIPTEPGKGIITATDSSTSISYHTGTITVNPGAVTHFDIDLINTQIASQSFGIKVTALDDNENIATSFNGTVQITDLSGTLNQSEVDQFFDGVMSTVVTVHQEYTDNMITVTETGGSPPTPSGVSNLFNVVAAPGIRIVGFDPVNADTVTFLQSVTTDQTVDWFLKMHVENMSSSTFRLEDIRLKFKVGSVSRDDYVVSLPNTFWDSGNNSLFGGSTDSLLIKVDATGHSAGSAAVEGWVYVINTSTGDSLWDHAFASFEAQTPAQLVIDEIRPSRVEATRGQGQRSEEYWSVTAIVRNSGGSGVIVDSNAANTRLSFSLGTGWIVSRPSGFFGGGWVISGGETKSLIYTIEKTGDDSAGSCVIDAFISGVENNTGRTVEDNTQGGRGSTVTLVHPAELQITQVISLAPNVSSNISYLNTSQKFIVRVFIQNSGGDGVDSVNVNIVNLNLGNAIIPKIAGGEIDSVDIFVQASPQSNPLEEFTAQVDGVADNTNRIIFSEKHIIQAVVQNPANLVVEQVVASESIVLGGRTDEWSISVVVRNTLHDEQAGQAVLILNPPQPTDLKFRVSGSEQEDYTVVPLPELKGGGLSLTGGAADTLIYRVTSTGHMWGEVEIFAQITGQDKNTGDTRSGSNSTSVVVQSEKKVLILSTQIEAYNTESGIGYVNTGQDFKVWVAVWNGLGKTTENIRVILRTQGESVIQDSIWQISALTPSARDTAWFDVKAADQKNSGEIFTAILTQDNQENVGSASDSTALVVIQEPASLSLSLEFEPNNPLGYFSTGQTFKLKVSLINNGTGEIDNSGRVRLTPPLNYIPLSPSNSSLIATDSPVEWSIQAPEQEQSAQTITVTMYQFPKEKNTGNSANVNNPTSSVEVTTIQTRLIPSLSISLPSGAIDDTLSTGQDFVVKATFEVNFVKNVTARIYLPTGYSTNDFEKSVILPNVKWQVKAPDEITGPGTIKVSSKGDDSLQEGVEIEGEVANLNVYTVSRADLYLRFSITSPPDAVQGSVSLGQKFIVSAEVLNKGEANTIGVTRVSLCSLPRKYSTDESITKNLVNGKVSWVITSPEQPTMEAVNIEARISTIPLDENTSDSAYVSQRNDKVAVTTVGTWLAVSTVYLSPHVNSLVIPGQDSVKFMILELDNRGETGANSILVDTLKFMVEDHYGNAIPPNSALSKIFIVNQEDTSDVYGELVQIPETNPLTITLGQEMVIREDRNLQVAIFGQIAESGEATYFQLNLRNGDYINAKDYDSKSGVPVRDVLVEELVDLRSNPKKVFHPEKESVLMNCPNPFGGPGEEETTIIYYLEHDTDVYFYIYTLVGELVWSKSYKATQSQGAVGIHSGDVMWGGVNDKGLKVLNGVYILVMKTGDGNVMKTKIAVVK